jgi:hypothetical protein
MARNFKQTKNKIKTLKYNLNKFIYATDVIIIITIVESDLSKFLDRGVLNNTIKKKHKSKISPHKSLRRVLVYRSIVFIFLFFVKHNTMASLHTERSKLRYNTSLLCRTITFSVLFFIVE